MAHVKSSLLAFVAVALFVGQLHCQDLHPDVEVLFDEYFRWELSTFPEAASFRGFREFDNRLSNFSIAGALEFERNCKDFHGRAQVLLDDDVALMTPDQRFFLWLLREETQLCLEGMAVRGYLFGPINFMDGIQVTLPVSFSRPSFFELKSVKDLDNVIARLEQVPASVDDIIDTLRVGMRENVTMAFESLSRVNEQFEAIQVDDVEDSLFFKPFVSLDPEKFDAAGTAQHRERAKRIIANRVLPAFRKLHAFVENEYMKALRPEPGLWSMADGQRFYQACLEHHTTVRDITPEKVHQIGKESIRDLRGKVEKVAAKLGFNMTATEMLHHMRTTKALTFSSQEEGMMAFKTVLKEKVNRKLEKVFLKENLPDLVYNVDVEEAPPQTAGFAFYFPPSRDGTRNGTFFVNLKDPALLRKSVITTLTLHEANPGHNLDSSNRVHRHLPNFARFRVNTLFKVPSELPPFHAAIEGWALYAEYLGLELGLYDDDYQLLGYYSSNMLRSARLVVDSGIHSLGWSRDQAIEYLLDNTDFTRKLVEQQVDRYITWPGQAASYRIGEGVIQDLRKKREKALGDKFNLKQFHADVLFCSGPMYGLDECIKKREKVAPR